MTLCDFFKIHNKVTVAVSGGVDSAYLLYAAKKYGASVRACFVKSEFVPELEEDDVKALSKELDVPITEIKLSLLSCREISRNDCERCYFCKKRIFEAVCKNAFENGFATVLEGTNASDDISDRPGFRAIGELGVLSPLRLCGIGKDEVRRSLKEEGISVWDKPSYSCLATRVKQGIELSSDKLFKIEKCEAFLRLLGFSDYRLRLCEENTARLELNINDKPLFFKEEKRVLTELLKHFSSVTFDLEARR